MDDQAVTVTILGRNYKLKIAKNDEEYLRQAVERINEQAKLYGRSFNYNDHQDLLAMVSLGQITEFVKLQASLQYKDEKLLDKLRDIDNVLDQYLHPTQNSL